MKYSFLNKSTWSSLRSIFRFSNDGFTPHQSRPAFSGTGFQPKPQRAPTPLLLGREGFTFLETMIAILVLATGIVAILQIFSLALNVETSNQRETQGALLAQEKMEEINSLNYEDIEVTTQTENPLPSPFEKFSRETKVIYVDSNLQQSLSDTGLKKIEVTITWKSPLKMKETHATTTLITLIAKR